MYFKRYLELAFDIKLYEWSHIPSDLEFYGRNNDEILDLMNSIGYALNIPSTYLTPHNEQIVLNSNNESSNISVDDVVANMSHSLSVQINHLIDSIHGDTQIDSSTIQKLYQQFLVENPNK